MNELIVILCSYLLGSIPFGLLLTRMAGLGDVRTIGSGNIGATNVMRTGKKWLGVLTLLLDMGKGAASIFMSVILLYPQTGDAIMNTMLLAAIAAIMGHIFPIWLKFKGGKGVATAFGVLIALDPMMGLHFTFFWLVVAFASRYVSLASILAFWCVFAVQLISADEVQLLFLLFLALLISYTHRGNISRLQQGTEPQVGKKKT